MGATPQSNATLAQIARALASADDICICGHVSPDGDCIGSELALACALRRLGKNVVALLAKDDPVDAGLSFLPGFDGLRPASDFVDRRECGTVPLRRFQTFVCVDVPTAERLGPDAALLHEAADQTITIDHHAVPERMSELSYTDPEAASTTQLVWEIACLLEAVGEDVATCAYTGLLTDTGGFRYQNVTAETLRVGAAMLDAGAVAASVASAVFQGRSLASLKLEALAVERAVILRDGQGIVSWLTRNDFARFSATKADAEPIVNALRSLRGVRVACMLREQEDSVRASLRAKDETDVSRIARLHAGGGHAAAAGCTFSESLEDAIAIVSREIVGALEEEDSEVMA